MIKKGKILLTITIIFVGLASYLIYDILNFKNRMYGISKIEKEISNRYVIGTRGKDRKICDNFLKYGCLEGNIISYNNDGSYIYIYYKPYDSYGVFSEGRNFYPVFGPYDNNVIKAESQKPDLIKLDIGTGYKEYYLSSDIEKLNNQDKEIFKELMKKSL